MELLVSAGRHQVSRWLLISYVVQYLKNQVFILIWVFSNRKNSFDKTFVSQLDNGERALEEVASDRRRGSSPHVQAARHSRVDGIYYFFESIH